MKKLSSKKILTLSESLLWDECCQDFTNVASERAIHYYQGLFDDFLNTRRSSSVATVKNRQEEEATDENYTQRENWDYGSLDDIALDVDNFDALEKAFESFLKKREKWAYYAACLKDPSLGQPLYFEAVDESYNETFSGLSEANKEGIKILKLEIQDRDRFACNDIQFAFIIAHLKGLEGQYKKLSDAEKVDFQWWKSVPRTMTQTSPADLRNLFRAGLTDFGPAFLAHFLNADTRRKLLNDLALEVDESEAPEEELIDVRIWDHLLRVKWYLDKFKLPSMHQDIIFKVILKMEPPYRDRMRAKEVSESDPSRPEPHFSHFLRVLRIGLGLIDAVRKQNYGLSGDLAHMYDDLYTDKSQKELDADGVLTYCLELLTHDLEEDFEITKIKNQAEVKAFLSKAVRSDYPQKEPLIDRVAASSHALNSKNYDSREQVLRTLRSDVRLARIKLPDMMQNHSSPYTTKVDKLRMYSDRFLLKYCRQGLLQVAPDRLLISSLAQNPALLEAGVVWPKVHQVLMANYHTDDMQKLADELQIPVAQTEAQMYY